MVVVSNCTTNVYVTGHLNLLCISCMEPPPYIPSVYKNMNKDFQLKVLYHIIYVTKNGVVTCKNILGRLVLH